MNLALDIQLKSHVVTRRFRTLHTADRARVVGSKGPRSPADGGSRGHGDPSSEQTSSSRQHSMPRGEPIVLEECPVQKGRSNPTSYFTNLSCSTSIAAEYHTLVNRPDVPAGLLGPAGPRRCQAPVHALPPTLRGTADADLVRVLLAATAGVLMPVRHVHGHQLARVEPQRDGDGPHGVVSPTVKPKTTDRVQKLEKILVPVAAEPIQPGNLDVVHEENPVPLVPIGVAQQECVREPPHHLGSLRVNALGLQVQPAELPKVLHCGCLIPRNMRICVHEATAVHALERVRHDVSGEVAISV
eukprot:CAMPEP_0204117436 /NCGR_PEP_ID=MMETSP0361-20130328/5970_1 /ASSEMBLY_ACC=CAM_ASM_000343 /TAXON_ID=268821 /ORGANISM="Scrippsiella Hangoei, Strain SHTV-5" /LENGTH=299 /DNA_ID=CAMNT_0051068331 /DNA_START=215 /DNA_END=1114 /DNA_ORIENTATION=+